MHLSAEEISTRATGISNQDFAEAAYGMDKVGGAGLFDCGAYGLMELSMRVVISHIPPAH
jgi:hypothetical protein